MFKQSEEIMTYCLLLRVLVGLDWTGIRTVNRNTANPQCLNILLDN